MKDPAFLFYPSDFLTGCTGLTMEERGQYISLLCIEHQTGRLSEKTIKLSVGNISEDLMNKFHKDEQGLYFNERLEVEIAKRESFISTRRNNGSKGGRPPKEKPTGLPLGKPNAKPTGKANKNLIEDVNINEIINEISNLFDIKYINDNSYKTINVLLNSYSKDIIIKCVKWAKNDSFWSTNFLSLNKLNQKNKDGVKYIDVFIAKMGTQKYEQPNANNKQPLKVNPYL